MIEIINEKLIIENDELNDNNETQISEYDLTSTPNDFNILTINSFIDSGAIIIPGFQRNYVWDIKRASKLIESIILGLPVPQVFLYEENRNKFLVIDGQQRLMTIFYFIRQRFPKKEKRTDLRKILTEKGNIPDEILYDDEFFTSFKLSLPKINEATDNKFKGLTYKTLGEYKTQFDLRPLRNIIVRQNFPSGDNSSVFEIFNRLNSGGVNLRPQEIRSSLYHSPFMDMVYKLNFHEEWRKLLNMEELDLHMKDVEILFRGFAFMIEGSTYKPSLANFLNKFAEHAKSFTIDDILYYKSLMESFFTSASNLPNDFFISPSTRRFNTFIFESLLNYIGNENCQSKTIMDQELDRTKIENLLSDSEYTSSVIGGTTNTENVENRFAATKRIMRNG